MEIKDDLLTIAPFTRPGKKIQIIKAIVIHWVGNSGTSAKANRDYMESLSKQNPKDNISDTFASCHYIIGLKGEILRLIPEDEIAYHAGGACYTQIAKNLFWDEQRRRIYPHDKCLGIELCHPDKTGKFNDETIESLKGLLIDIFKRHELTPQALKLHFDITSKYCPKWFVDNTDEWNKFVSSF